MKPRRKLLTARVRRAIRRALTYYDTCLSSWGDDFEGLAGDPKAKALDDLSAAFTWLHSIESGGRVALNHDAMPALVSALSYFVRLDELGEEITGGQWNAAIVMARAAIAEASKS